MVKSKRVSTRQRVEQKLERGALPKKSDDLNSIISAAKSTPWDVRSDVFKNVEVGSAIVKERLQDFDDSDAKTIITSKSFRGLNIRKKDKRKIKQHLFKRKINIIQEAKEALKAKKKREKTIVTGDMQPMANSLPTILPSVEQYIANNRTNQLASRESDSKKQSSRNRKKQQLADIGIFQKIQQHSEYKSNPSSTIQEHLENRLILENQTMDTA
ncbi:ribosome biogenesis protein SLX9 homolog [Watersipora subatra]|uniref:ribosome biogenesis protein SLX9 homolog n=1 Tax=Watersipora subatra TaxID=2589382 RepID=UPI00355B364B